MRMTARTGLAVAVALWVAASAAAADITVTTTADGLANDGQCALREALTAAQLGAPYLGCASGSAGADTVVLGAGRYTLALAGYEDGNLSGDLDTGSGSEVRILGAGPASTTIDGDGVDRVLDVPSTGVLTLEGLTVRGGRAQPGGFGGGVRNGGRLVVRRVMFTDNRSGLAMPVPPGALGDTGPGGGAIATLGTASDVTVQDSTFDGNRASNGGQGGPSTGGGGRGGDGGAILVLAGSASIHGSTFTANLAGAGGSGGGIGAAAGQGGNGGAIAVFAGDTLIVNDTFSANRAGDPGPGNGSAGGGGGGAIAGGLGPTARTIVGYSTFAGNLRGAGSTDGNAVSGVTAGGNVWADAAPACAFTMVVRPSLVPVGDASCGGLAIPGDARLGPLADNGGPTRTFLPGEGSPAIDIASTCAVTFPFGDVDQRGVTRNQRDGCDAGSVEVVPPAPSAPPIGPGPAPVPTPTTPPTGTAVAVLSNLRLSPAAFRPGRGTNVAFRLSARARVVLTVRRTLAGRRLGTRCVAPARAPRGAARCRRTVTLRGSIVRTLPAGAASLRLPGRLGGVTLPPGAYVLAVRVAGGATVLRGFRVSP